MGLHASLPSFMVPTTEYVLALDDADLRTRRRARRLAMRGEVAEDLETARATVAVAQEWQRRSPSPGTIVFLCAFMAAGLAACVALYAEGHVAAGVVGCVAVPACAWFIWLQRRARVGAPLAERANLALLEQAGRAHELTGESRSIAVAPARLLVSALASLVAWDLWYGTLLLVIGDERLALDSVVTRGATFAIMFTTLTALRRPWVWRPGRIVGAARRGPAQI